LEETPCQQYGTYYRVPPATQILVCLTANGRTSFAVSDPTLQAAALLQTSKKYGVHFSAAQATSLKVLPFLAVKLDQLPASLAITGSSISANNGKQTTNSGTLTETQLLDCVEVARDLSTSVTTLPARIYLLVDSQATASTVMRLLRLFQEQQISRVQLLNHIHS